jgi:predicted secreted protein
VRPILRINLTHGDGFESMAKIHLLQEKLKDERGKKVIFLSHCLLNENTRYLGGAFRKAGIDELIDELQKQGIGIVQMKCPEQKTWGGVLKREMLMGYGIKGTPLNAFRKAYMLFFIWKTGRSFRKIAKEVVSEIKDYIDSGFEVSGIVGIKGSPSCGISAAYLDIEKLNKEYFNQNCYKKCLVNKSGIYFDALKQELSAKNLKINFFEHDLLLEIEGKLSNINFTEVE